MSLWDVNSPDYEPPSVDNPAWVWSIVGWGYNKVSTSNGVVIRLDYVKLDDNGNFIRVNNFHPGWASSVMTMYIPIFMTLNEGNVGTTGGNFVGGYDYWASQGANEFWKGYIYKFLYGMKSISSLPASFPIPNPLP